jgi:hypothetical protein
MAPEPERAGFWGNESRKSWRELLRLFQSHRARIALRVERISAYPDTQNVLTDRRIMHRPGRHQVLDLTKQEPDRYGIFSVDSTTEKLGEAWPNLAAPYHISRPPAAPMDSVAIFGHRFPRIPSTTISCAPGCSILGGPGSRSCSHPVRA